MIVKSMSRKVASFGQLIGYIDRDEGQEPYRIRHNLLSRDPAHIRTEFERNGDLLQQRKNGVYLYHEIISITRAQGLSAEEQKSRLYEIAQSYIAARCPDNLVFGGLHQDKAHSFHYHLMISANRAGERGRLRLTKAQFRQIQVSLENHVLEQYPELEQKVAIGKRADKKMSRKEGELERRTGKRPKREEVLARVRDAFAASTHRDSFLDALGRNDLELYVRGKTLGVIDHESGKRHRLKTLDAELAEQIELRMVQQEGERAAEAEKALAGEKEKGAEREKRRDDRRHQSQETPGAHNEDYVNNGSNADLNRDAPSKQKEDVEQEQKPEMGEQDMSRGDNLKEPSPERQELIDKGHIQPDPERDRMTHEDWRAQGKFSTQIQQSWRRTMDDLRGRTKDLEERARGQNGGKGKDDSEPER